MTYKIGKQATVHFLPSNKKVKVQIGTSILNAALRNRISLSHICNGKCSCTTCKVKLIEGNLSVIQPCEEMRLRDDLKQEGFRLACQSLVIENVTVEIPEDRLKTAIRAQLLKQQNEEL